MATALEVERGIATAHPADLAALEPRRRAVLERNRRRIAEGMA